MRPSSVNRRSHGRVARAALLALLLLLLGSACAAGKTSTTAVSTSASQGGETERVGCPNEKANPRWPVKTLSDPSAEDVNFTPQDSTVSHLLALPGSRVGAHEPRMAGVEQTTYRLHVRLVRMELQEDRDVHLVMADTSDPNALLLAELPDTKCHGAASSAEKAEMRSARTALAAACGPASMTDTHLSGTAVVTGVAFFDPVPSISRIELHPLLSFRSSDCAR